MTANPSTAPSAPWPSGLTLLRWAICDQLWLNAFSKKLTCWQKLSLLLKAHLWVIVLTCLLCATGIGLTAVFELPLRFPDIYEPRIAAVFQNAPSRWTQAAALVSVSIIGITLGLALSLALSITLDIASSLIINLAFGLAFGLASGLAFSLAFSLALGITLGLAFEPGISLIISLALGITLGLALGIAYVI